jgi:hypothetical protein
LHCTSISWPSLPVFWRSKTITDRNIGKLRACYSIGFSKSYLLLEKILQNSSIQQKGNRIETEPSSFVVNHFFWPVKFAFLLWAVAKMPNCSTLQKSKQMFLAFALVLLTISCSFAAEENSPSNPIFWKFSSLERFAKRQANITSSQIINATFVIQDQ